MDALDLIEAVLAEGKLGEILWLLGEFDLLDGGQSMSIAALCNGTRLDAAECERLVSTLVNARLVVRDGVGARITRRGIAATMLLAATERS